MNGVGKCPKIRHILKLKHIGRKWRKLASARKAAQDLAYKLISSRSCRACYVSDDEHIEGNKSNEGSVSAVPPDVPAGHLAVYVGQQCSRRFIIRAAYLNHPVFRALLQLTEEEFGYTCQGALAIPCDEVLFEHILSLFNAIESSFCNEWFCSSEAKGIPLAKESRLLLDNSLGDETSR